MTQIQLPSKDLTKPVKKEKKRKPRRTVEQKTAAQLVKVADEVFSWYVRLRDCDYKDGAFIGTCITCSKTGTVAWFDEGKLRFTKGWDAGHFVGRGNKVVRFDELNVNLQCSFRCNRMRSGEHEKYRVALREKYGKDTPEELEKLAESTPFYKFSKPELLQIIEDSKIQVAWYASHCLN